MVAPPSGEFFKQYRFCARVHIVKYMCVYCKVRCRCIFYDAVSDTIRRRGGYRAIITEDGVDTMTYFGGNHGSRV